MKMSYQHHHNRSALAAEILLESHLSALARQRPIEAVVARFEECHHRSPRFLARVHVIIPGPDITVTAQDHSLAAAVTKAAKIINSRVQKRAHKRALRIRADSSRPSSFRKDAFSRRPNC